MDATNPFSRIADLIATALNMTLDFCSEYLFLILAVLLGIRFLMLALNGRVSMFVLGAAIVCTLLGISMGQIVI